MSAPPIREGAVILDQPADFEQRRAAPEQAAVVAVGTRAELCRMYPAAPETRANGVLLPALVNAHTHLELAVLRGQVPGGSGVVAWTRGLAMRLPRIDPARALDAAVTAAAEAKAFGTGAIADVGNGTIGWRAMRRAGLGGVFFHELVGSREARTGDALGDAAAERAAVSESERPPAVAAIPAPHAPYSVGPALMRRIFAAAAAVGCSTTIHLAEDLDEILLLRDGSGAWPAILRSLGVDPAERAPHQSPTQYLETLGAFASHQRPPLLVHMVHADADDRRRAATTGATVVLCARSNLHIGGRLPDVPALVADGVRLAIGTDSLASATNMSLWQELATLATHFPEVPAAAWLHAATRGGASALGFGLMGCLAAGQCPGLVDVIADGSTADDATDVQRALVSNGNPTVNWISPGLSATVPPDRSPYPAPAPEARA